MPGTHDGRFDEVVDLLARHVADGTELGASLCVVQDGEVVLDVWDGWTDADRTLAWERDTLVPVWSITKTMTNLAALVLADRGLIDVEEPVATYWPEFAAAGKERVTVAHLLSHASGVSGWAQPVEVDDLYDWDRSTTMLAAQEPWWEPGSAPGYHLVNQGHLVGEVVRRVTGDSLGTWFAREIAEPLGADFHVGLSPADDHRVATLTPPRMPDDVDGSVMMPGSPSLLTFTGPFLRATEANTERWRRAEIPAANGIGNARSIARVQSVVSHDGDVDGVRLLTPGRASDVLEPRAEGLDRVLNLPTRFGLGWGLPTPDVMPSVEPGRRCYWGGLGGSVVVNDLERRITIAYAMNRMVFETVPGFHQVRPCGDARSDAYLAAIGRVL